MASTQPTKTRKVSLPTINVRRSLPKASIVLDTYWKFAHERQNIYFRRLRGNEAPWTNDPILHLHKFTNAYRASDRVSQFLIKSVIYDGPQNANDLFFRVLIFKIFNKIETWRSLEELLGGIRAKTFHLEKYSKILDQLQSERSIYSAAYIMPSGGGVFPKKYLMHLHLVRKMMADKLPQKLENAQSMEDAFKLLRSYPTIGDFLAYQFVTDLNYTQLLNFSEMDFVVPGPGARDGLKKCFTSLGDLSESEAIRYVTEMQDREFDRLGLKFLSLWGRPLQLIDCQNIFCETDKYARVAHPDIKGRTDRTRIKQKFVTHGDLERPFFPPKWKINEKIAANFCKNKSRPKRLNDSFAP